MAAKHENTYILNANINQICNILRSPQFASVLNLDLKSENPSQTGVWFRFHHGVTFTSWGEKITVTLTALGPAHTQTNIHSECGMPTQVVDWGKNKQVVCNIYEQLCASLKTMAAPGPIPEPMPASEPVRPRANFCPACGTALPENANFCSRCGKKI